MLCLIGSAASAERNVHGGDVDNLDMVATMRSLIDFVENAEDVDLSPRGKTNFHGTWHSIPLHVRVAPPGSLWEQFLEDVAGDVVLCRGFPVFLPNIHWLLTVKKSHMYAHERQFDKTRADIIYLEDEGAMEMDSEWVADRQAEIRERPEMRDMFFTEPTDELPEPLVAALYKIVAIGLEPAYFNFNNHHGQPELGKWRACTHFTRDCAIYEATAVMALLWGMIPHSGKGLNPRKTFVKALDRICTVGAKSFMRKHAWENYERILNRYDSSWYDEYLRAQPGDLVAAAQATP